MQVPRVLFEDFQRNVLQRGRVGGGQFDRGGSAGLVGFLPAQRTQTPAVAGLQAGETEFGPRRAQVVALRFGERQKRCGDFDTDGMQADVFSAGITTAVAVEPGQRPAAAKLQPVAQNVLRFVHSTDSLFRDRGRDVWAVGIHVQRARLRDDDKVHIFHRNRAEQDLIPHDQGSAEPDPILETDFQRADVRYEPPAAVRQDHFFPIVLGEMQLHPHMFGNAEMDRPGVGQRLDFDRGEVGLSRIFQCHVSVHDAHVGLFAALHAGTLAEDTGQSRESGAGFDDFRDVDLRSWEIAS